MPPKAEANPCGPQLCGTVIDDVGDDLRTISCRLGRIARAEADTCIDTDVLSPGCTSPTRRGNREPGIGRHGHDLRVDLLVIPLFSPGRR